MPNAAPQQAELEAQHRAGDGADGEQHARHLRPPPRQQHRRLVLPADAAVVRDQHQERERDAEGHQDDVEAQRERHLLARRDQLRGVRGQDGGLLDHQRRQCHGRSAPPESAVPELRTAALDSSARRGGGPVGA